MDIKGEAQIPASLKTVWAGLNSTDVLLQAIPGCESIERISENELQAKVMIKLGPVTARFSGKVSMTDIRPLEGYTLHFEGSGGAAGFAKGSAEIHLQESGGETRLTYTAKASIGGKLGQLGSRLIEGSARKLSADFLPHSRRRSHRAGSAPLRRQKMDQQARRLLHPPRHQERSSLG